MGEGGPYLLGQLPQPVGLQQQEVGTRREARPPDRQKPGTDDTQHAETKQPNDQKWDEDEEQGGRTVQQAGNKVKRRSKTMSNVEIVKNQSL